MSFSHNMNVISRLYFCPRNNSIFFNNDCMSNLSFGQSRRKLLCVSAIITTLALSSSSNLFGANLHPSQAIEPGVSQQNEITVKGQITDAAGIPLIGVNILQKGSTNGVVTDIDGNFTINVPQGSTLVASYIGYTSQEIKAQAGQLIRVTLTEAEASIQQKMIVYGDDGHYDTASAFIKSMRGSDPDAAVYYLAKMLHAGEDIRFIARRLTIFAAEDVGNADPRALELCTAAMQAVEMIGLPEAKLILAQATTYCATAPKSNASYAALEAAATDVEQERVQPIPVRLRDAHYAGAKAEGIGKDYLYPHDYPGGFVPQEYLSVDKRYYEPKEIGYEARIRERVDYWRALRDFVREEKRDGKA